MSGSTVEPHDKMRGRDVNKVARGEQAPRPPQHTPNVSRPPPPSSTTTTTPKSEKERARRCYDSYYEYHRCIEEKGADAEACKKVADYYKSTCPDWIGRWRIQ